MKQALLLFFVSLLLTAGFEYSNAQVFTSYTAKDGIETIISKAKTKGISDPELYAIASGNMSVDNMPVQVQFSLTDGKANIWLYYVKSKSNPDSKLIFAVTYTILLGQEIYSTFDISYDTFKKYLPFEPSSTLDTYQWINSTELYSHLAANTDYINYQNSTGTTNPTAILLAVNTLPEYGDFTAYWIMEFPNNGEKFICGVDAVTGGTRCENLNSGDVKSLNGSEIYLFPNPANEFLSVKTNSIFKDSDLNIKIYNNEGKVELSSILTNYLSDNLIIPLQSISSGAYILELSNGKITTSFNFIVTK